MKRVILIKKHSEYHKILNISIVLLFIITKSLNVDDCEMFQPSRFKIIPEIKIC